MTKTLLNQDHKKKYKIRINTHCIYTLCTNVQVLLGNKKYVQKREIKTRIINKTLGSYIDAFKRD